MNKIHLHHKHKDDEPFYAFLHKAKLYSSILESFVFCPIGGQNALIRKRKEVKLF